MIKFLITLFLIYMIMRFVFPHLLRWAIKAFIKKNIQNGTFTNVDRTTFRSANQQQPEGKVNIDYIPKKPQQNDSGVGEYVDYEEVK